MQLLNDIVKYANRLRIIYMLLSSLHSREPIYLFIYLNFHPFRNDPDWIPPPSHPIDYCYFQKEHLNQVNDLLQKNFWPEIEGTN